MQPLNMQLATLQAQLIAEKQRVAQLQDELAEAYAVLRALGLRP